MAALQPMTPLKNDREEKEQLLTYLFVHADDGRSDFLRQLRVDVERLLAPKFRSCSVDEVRQILTILREITLYIEYARSRCEEPNPKGLINILYECNETTELLHTIREELNHFKRWYKEYTPPPLPPSSTERVTKEPAELQSSRVPPNNQEAVDLEAVDAAMALALQREEKEKEKEKEKKEKETENMLLQAGFKPLNLSPTELVTREYAESQPPLGSSNKQVLADEVFARELQDKEDQVVIQGLQEEGEKRPNAECLVAIRGLADCVVHQELQTLCTLCTTVKENLPHTFQRLVSMLCELYTMKDSLRSPDDLLEHLQDMAEDAMIGMSCFIQKVLSKPSKPTQSSQIRPTFLQALSIVFDGIKCFETTDRQKQENVITIMFEIIYTKCREDSPLILPLLYVLNQLGVKFDKSAVVCKFIDDKKVTFIDVMTKNNTVLCIGREDFFSLRHGSSFSKNFLDFLDDYFGTTIYPVPGTHPLAINYYQHLIDIDSRVLFEHNLGGLTQLYDGMLGVKSENIGRSPEQVRVFRETVSDSLNTLVPGASDFVNKFNQFAQNILLVTKTKQGIVFTELQEAVNALLEKNSIPEEKAKVYEVLNNLLIAKLISGDPSALPLLYTLLNIFPAKGIEIIKDILIYLQEFAENVKSTPASVLGQTEFIRSMPKLFDASSLSWEQSIQTFKRKIEELFPQEVDCFTRFKIGQFSEKVLERPIPRELVKWFCLTTKYAFVLPRSQQEVAARVPTVLDKLAPGTSAFVTTLGSFKPEDCLAEKILENIQGTIDILVKDKSGELLRSTQNIIFGFMERQWEDGNPLAIPLTYQVIQNIGDKASPAIQSVVANLKNYPRKMGTYFLANQNEREQTFLGFVETLKPLLSQDPVKEAKAMVDFYKQAVENFFKSSSAVDSSSLSDKEYLREIWPIYIRTKVLPDKLNETQLTKIRNALREEGVEDLLQITPDNEDFMLFSALIDSTR